MPSGSLGSEKGSAIRGLLFMLVELRHGDDTHVVAVIEIAALDELFQ
jgi:hypothetical protein